MNIQLFRVIRPSCVGRASQIKTQDVDTHTKLMMTITTRCTMRWSGNRFTHRLLVLIAAAASPFLAQDCFSFGPIRIPHPIVYIPCYQVSSGCTITSVVPALDAPEVTVTAEISLANANAVYFGTTPAPSFTVNSDGSLAVVVPSFLPRGSTFPISVLLNDLSVLFRPATKSMLYGTPTYSVSLAEMDITGPLPVYTYGDPAWINSLGPQNHSFALPPAGLNLMYGSWPTFHVATYFSNSSNPETTGPPYIEGTSNWGNLAKFNTQLEVCDIGATQGDGNCTNWDGNTGYWAIAKEIPKVLNLPSIGSFTYSDVPIYAGPPIMDAQNLAHTFRLRLFLAASDSYAPAYLPNRIDSAISQPFTAVVAPNAYLQVKVLPLTIVYAPPGNQSTVSFTTSNTYNTNYNLGSSDTQTNKDTDANSGSLDYLAKYGLSASGLGKEGSGTGASAGVDYSMGYGEAWDSQTSTGVGVQTGQQLSGSASQGISVQYGITQNHKNVPGNGQVCASATDCSTLTQDPNWLANLPFWDDLFVLMIHPQFAIYVLGSGAKPPPVLLLEAVPMVPKLQSSSSGSAPLCKNQVD